MGVNGAAAAQKLLSFGRVNPGYCLYYVWQAYKAVGARVNGSWPTAWSAWLTDKKTAHTDKNPPAGVPVYFGQKAGSAAGDVVISLGGGRVACTDYPSWGQVGSCTIDERQRQIGRPYMGWTETILGVPIDFAKPSTGKPASSKPAAKIAPETMLRWRWSGVQEMLKRFYGYTGRIDNDPGSGTISAMQRFIKAKGYRNLAVDGRFGPETCKGVQSWLKARWGYTGAIDAIPGSGTRAAWDRAERANAAAF